LPMINIKTLTTALFDLLDASSTLHVAGCTIERSTRINFDPSRTPWVGVYPGTVTTTPKAMGGRMWQNETELQIVIQEASLSDDGTSASDALEDIIDAVLTVVDGDLTLGVANVRVLSINREYSYVVLDSDGNGELFMPQAILKIKLEVRS